MTQAMRAVFVGDGSLLVRCAQAWREAGHEVAGVASGEDAVLAWAREQGLRGERCDAAPSLEGLDFDALFSVANLRVLPQALLERARRIALNFHDGPLPRYAGLNAPAWALMAGERTHGITWHEMGALVDAGRIACQRLFELAPDETTYSLNTRCYEAGFQGFVEMIPAIAGGTLVLTEPVGPRVVFQRHDRPARLGTLDWREPAHRLCALVRALDFGPTPNPLALPKLWTGERLLHVLAARVVDDATPAVAGTVIDAQGPRLRVATGRGVLEVEVGEPLGDDAWPTLTTAPRAHQALPAMPPQTQLAIERASARLARAEPAWRQALLRATPLRLPHPRRTDAVEGAEPGTPLRLPLQACEQGSGTLAALASWLAALTGEARIDLLYADAVLAEAAHPLAPWASAWVPVSLEVAPQQDVAACVAHAQALIDQAHRLGPITCDLSARLGLAPGETRRPSVALSVGAAAPPPGCELALCCERPGEPLALLLDEHRHAPAVAQEIARQLEAWLQAFAQAVGPVASLSLLPGHDAARLDVLQGPLVRAEGPRSVHEAVAAGTAQSPDAQALRWRDEVWTRAQLHARVDTLARALRSRGVSPGDVVGVCLARSPQLVVAVLAILRCGAAYLPLDPEYPRERLRFMVDDALARCVVARETGAALLGLAPERLVGPDAVAPPEASPEPPLPEVAGDAPAYLIYTSGSTGRPKGVVVTHANVLNFFAGMDLRVPRREGARWLAVTSLSFDISVLELLWTLARGFTVALSTSASQAAATGGPQFSLFYFASDAGQADSEAYRLLLEGARFADRHGFAAVWTPERHFHAFGGPYPNPALASAALATITTRVGLRAGSCVLPLHHPLRLAEDWAMVDQLSKGRVGLSLAAGWQPQDFVLAPEAFASRKQALLEGVDTLRRLWRGEALECPGPQGPPVSVHTLPRPVQPELPLWLTAAANPQTFAQAGTAGCHVLTHLLGQTLEELTAKIALYRAARSAAGHEGPGVVTLMLHTFVGDDEAAVHAAAREPLKAYLRSSVDLIRRAAWTFPTFVEQAQASGRSALEVMDAQPLSDAEMQALLAHAYDRYSRGSALIGTPAQCLSRVHRLQEAGVDEIACLIDFGIDTDTVLAHLRDLHDLMQQAQLARRGGTAMAVAAEMRAHEITHLQCTPSLATILAADGAGREALGRLEALLVGGEALGLPLARELRAQVPGRVLNLYGPTETTVWSTCCELGALQDFVPLGEPIANTRLFIRNAWGQECPALVPGELWIGGEGVSRGYHGQDALTAQRFVPQPGRPQARAYRTGDLVRRHPDGRLEFLGRMDHQVKIRGHRIELGEIENILAGQAGVHEAVALACQDAVGQPFLHAWVTPREAGRAPEPPTLLAALAQALPPVMRPRGITVLASMPRTPNGKTDRQALARQALEGAGDAPVPVPAAGPAASNASTEALAGAQAPATAELPLATASFERLVASLWCEALGRQGVGREANFFDLGGHSLLVIQVQRRLREATGVEVAVVDMFRLTTVAALARHLAEAVGAPAAAAMSAPVPQPAGSSAPIEIDTAAAAAPERARTRRALHARRIQPH